MSVALEQIEYAKALEQKAELEAVSYGDLKQKFTDLGIPEIWKQGKKKEELINLALQRLEEVKAIEAKGINLSDPIIISKLEDEKEKELIAGASVEEIELVDEIILDESHIKEEEPKELVKIKHNYTKEQIEENLELIQCNLNQATPVQRTLLFEKQAELLIMLDDFLV
jgi:phage terminase large subunit GpA-like protein